MQAENVQITVGVAPVFTWAAECPQFAVARAEPIDGNTGYVWSFNGWLVVEFSQYLKGWVFPADLN